MSIASLSVDYPEGAEILDCICDAKRKAEQYEFDYINFHANGIDFSISRRCDVDIVYDEYKLQCWREKVTKISIQG